MQKSGIARGIERLIDLKYMFCYVCKPVFELLAKYIYNNINVLARWARIPAHQNMLNKLCFERVCLIKVISRLSPFIQPLIGPC